MSKNGKTTKPKKPQVNPEDEATTFILMILTPATTTDRASLTGWCVIASQGMDRALGHIKNLDLGGIDVSHLDWTPLHGDGKTANLADGKRIQLLPAPCYVVEDKTPMIIPPHIM